MLAAQLAGAVVKHLFQGGVGLDDGSVGRQQGQSDAAVLEEDAEAVLRLGQAMERVLQQGFPFFLQHEKHADGDEGFQEEADEGHVNGRPRGEYAVQDDVQKYTGEDGTGYGGKGQGAGQQRLAGIALAAADN